MIVRILSEGQYRLDSSHLDQLNALDNRLVQIVASGDEAQYRDIFSQMLTIVRDKSSRIPLEELLGSDIVLPAPDTTLKEVQRLFAGEGLIPG